MESEWEVFPLHIVSDFISFSIASHLQPQLCLLKYG